MSLDRFSPSQWLMGILASLCIAGTVGWVSSVEKLKDDFEGLTQALIRIETKLDLLLERQ
jgi:hypothetical protein